jgi:hypothetical protein
MLFHVNDSQRFLPLLRGQQLREICFCFANVDYAHELLQFDRLSLEQLRIKGQRPYITTNKKPTGQGWGFRSGLAMAH